MSALVALVSRKSAMELERALFWRLIGRGTFGIQEDAARAAFFMHQLRRHPLRRGHFTASSCRGFAQNRETPSEENASDVMAWDSPSVDPGPSPRYIGRPFVTADKRLPQRAHGG